MSQIRAPSSTISINHTTQGWGGGKGGKGEGGWEGGVRGVREREDGREEKLRSEALRHKT